DDEGVVEKAMNGKSQLLPRAESESISAKYEYTCSDLISTPDCSYLLMGCKNGEVLQLQLQRPDAQVTSPLGFKEILHEGAAIDQIAIFKGASDDVTNRREMLFGVLLGVDVHVFVLSLDGTRGVNCLVVHKKSKDGASVTSTMLGMGSLWSGHHDLWVFSEKSVEVCIGERGKFPPIDKMKEQSKLLLEGYRSAVTGTTAFLDAADEATFHLDVVCVG
ncbi:hypothetical protein PFISCL1PPCAC_22148, partial [Pristionchus fissidentatus]